jgi:hypothetical protein
MKRLIALVLVVALFGTVYADVMPQRKLSRPLVNLESGYQPWPGPLVLPMLRWFVPLWPVVAAPRGYAPDPSGVVPIPPPVCDVSCLLRPVQGIAW